MKSIAKNSVFNLIYNILNVLFPLVTGIYVSHILLSNSIGEVEAARNIAQYFVILSFLGIPTYGLREIAKVRNDKEKMSKLYSELMVINGISTTVFLGVYMVVIVSVPTYSANLPLYLITGLSILFNMLNNSWFYEGIEEFSYICVRNIIVKALMMILLIVFVRNQNDYLIYAAITVVGIFGNYILNVARSRKYVRFSFKALNLKRHLKPILFLVAVNLAIEIYTLVDITMLRFLSTTSNVAYYSYGSKIYKILLQLFNSLTVVVVPRLSQFRKSNQQKDFDNLLSKTLSTLIVFAIPTIIGIVFVSDFVITLMYGAEYYSSASVLKILSFILLVSPASYLLGSRVLLVTDNEKKMIIPVLIGAVVNVVCNYFLIKSFNEKGAAYASLISEIVVAAVYIILSYKYFNLSKRVILTIAKSIVSSALMYSVLVLLKFNHSEGISSLIKQIVLAPIVYFSMMIALKEDTTLSISNKLLGKLISK